MKMSKKFIKTDDTEIEEYKFHQYKGPISINNIDINKIVVFDKFTFGKQDFKYFISYKDNKEIIPLCIFFLEMVTYKWYSDKTKYMYFMIEDKYKCKYIKFGEKVSNIIKTNFNGEPIYNKIYLKAEKRLNTKKKVSLFICTSNIYWFNLQKKWKLLS